MGSERSLPSRRRKKANPGRPIRVSRAVYIKLDRSRGNQSWDCFFRANLGLPTRKGRPQPLVEGVLDPHSGLMILRIDDAPWKELEALARKISEKSKLRLAPIRMREIR